MVKTDNFFFFSINKCSIDWIQAVPEINGFKKFAILPDNMDTIVGAQKKFLLPNTW